MNHPSKHTEWTHYETFASGIEWPEGQAIPSFSRPEGTLDAFNLISLSEPAKAMLTTLQGLINRTKTRIYLHGNHALGEGLHTWCSRYNLKLHEETNLVGFVQKYAGELDGIVLYSQKRSPHYRNLACTIAGLRNLLPIEKELYEGLMAEGLDLPVVCDLRDLPYTTPAEIYTYLYENYWKDCTKRILCNMSAAAFIRDMAAATGAASVWLDPRNEDERTVLDRFLEDMTPGKSVILGWWAEERSGIGEGTHYGISTIPSDFYDNSTVHAAMSHVMHIPAVPKKPRLENKIYLALFFSDGDNVQYCQHHMSVLWGNPDRGTVPLNWTVSPGLVDIGRILNYYFDTASENDCIVSGPSGLGYALIYDEHNQKLFLTDEKRTDAYTEFTNRYLVKNGIRAITAWDQLRDIHFRSYEKNCRGLYGLTQEDWYQKPAPLKLHIENDRLAFVPNCPAYAAKIENIFDKLEEQIRDYDGSRPLFFAAQGITWRLTPENIKKLKEQIDAIQPGKIEVLRADHFFALLNEYEGIPYNLALSPDLTVSVNDKKDASIVTNGSPYGENLWKASETGSRTFTFDLGSEYTLSRYVIKHAGVNSVDAALNNRDFTVSASLDGESWATVDCKENNTADITDVDFDPVLARYFKLTVTKGGKDDIVRIGDIEIYGAVSGN